MGGDVGPQADSVMERLRGQLDDLDFFQAVRHLECAAAPVRIGQSVRPADDPVRFCQEPSLAFPASTLAKFLPAEGLYPARLYVRFLGFFGPNGALPLILTEYACQDNRRARPKDSAQASAAGRDGAMVAFCNIFHHRFLSLFYRAWAAAQQTVSFEHPESDRFSVYFASLFGLGMPSLRDRDAVPDVAKLHFAGRLSCRARHAEGLAAILESFFGVPAGVDEFLGQWIPLPDASRLRLGESPDSGSLGISTIVGKCVWDCQQKFRIGLGPMGLQNYMRLLPGGESLRRLVAWVRNYVGDELAWDVRLALKAHEVPDVTLGHAGLLGWTTWLKSRPFEADAEDLVLSPAA